ncbi:hypothetical protein J6590_002793 [Homalodisca vitripennis]|nr:hypothetical protein J6590_002793 [Homalodisca vitripennis]
MEVWLISLIWLTSLVDRINKNTVLNEDLADFSGQNNKCAIKCRVNSMSTAAGCIAVGQR